MEARLCSGLQVKLVLAHLAFPGASVQQVRGSGCGRSVSACSMGNKEEELGAIVLLQSYNLVAITETWWNKSHDWSVTVDGHRLFRSDRRGRKEGWRVCPPCQEMDRL